MTDEKTPGDDQATARLLWQANTPGRRGPTPTLSLPAIAAAGVTIADAEGLTAVTMQRIAAALEVTKMALYRYVPGKSELVALMVERAVAEPPSLESVSGGWFPKLHTWAHHLFERFQRHPWIIEATVGMRVMGPHELGWTEQAVAALTDTGLDGGEMLDVAATLAGHVRAIAQQGAGPSGSKPEYAMENTLTRLLQGHEDRFPALCAALNSTADHESQDQALEFGLQRILEGVHQLVATRD